MRGKGGGGCEVSANENSCAHHVTWSPNKLWRSNSIFLICFVQRKIVFRKKSNKFVQDEHMRVAWQVILKKLHVKIDHFLRPDFSFSWPTNHDGTWQPAMPEYGAIG